LQSLENVLRSPKQRGVLGEYFLENVLKNVLPPHSYQMQYKFKNGEIVDSVVFVKDKIIPIDSKFSLENYNKLAVETDPLEKEKLEKIFIQDLKNRIDETSKYIRPEENTMDFAFMFIPSEGVYYDLLINKVGNVKLNNNDLINYAFAQKKVIIVSPTSFLAYLQTVLQGLRALQIEDSAKQILIQVTNLKKHLELFEDNFSKMGKHLGTVVGAYNSSYKNFKSVDKDLFKITGEQIAITAEELERPLED
jgi:DNA recombination protein RmuC